MYIVERFQRSPVCSIRATRPTPHVCPIMLHVLDLQVNTLLRQRILPPRKRKQLSTVTWAMGTSCRVTPKLKFIVSFFIITFRFQHLGDVGFVRPSRLSSPPVWLGELTSRFVVLRRPDCAICLEASWPRLSALVRPCTAIISTWWLRTSSKCIREDPQVCVNTCVGKFDLCSFC